jgi:hypothetical protein
MQRNNIEMFFFILVIVFVFFSGQLDPKINLTITAILLGVIFIYRARSNPKSPKKK